MGAAVARYRIKELAAERGVSLYRLSRMSGTNEARLRLLANNKLENITVLTLERLAAALGRPLGDVFEPESLKEIPTFEEAVLEEADQILAESGDIRSEDLDSESEG